MTTSMNLSGLNKAQKKDNRDKTSSPIADTPTTNSQVGVEKEEMQPTKQPPKKKS